MQVKPILYTILIASGFALLANSWVVNQDMSTPLDLQKSSLSGFSTPLAAPKMQLNSDTVDVKPSRPAPVTYDTLDVSQGIQNLVLEARIKKQLFKNEVLRSVSITISVASGRVVLDGKVASIEVKQLIEATVERVKGVVELESNIKYA